MKKKSNKFVFDIELHVIKIIFSVKTDLLSKKTAISIHPSQNTLSNKKN